MNISQLLNSTNSMGGTRTLAGCLSKALGTIYKGNKEVQYDPKYNTVEIVLYFGSKTQADVSLHRASIVLKDVKQYECTEQELIQYLKDKLGIKLFDYVYDIAINKFGADFSLSEDDEYMRQYLELVKAEFEAPYEMRLKRSTLHSDRLSEIRWEIKQLREDIKNFEMHGWKTEQKINSKLAEYAIPVNEIKFMTPEELEFRKNIYKTKIDEIKQEKKDWEKREYYDKKDKLTTLQKEAEELTSRYERKTLSGRQLLQEESFKRTDEYQKRKEALLHNLPDELIIQVAIENPFIVGSKVIVPKDSNLFLVVDKEVSLDTECKVNCSCFTGDTRVQLANGTSLSLKDLENITDFKVLAYNTETGKYEYARALNCTKRQENAKLLRITLADGTSIRVTPSHRFLNSNCEWKSAQELEIGDFLKYNDNYYGYENHEQKTSSSTFIYLDPTQEGDYQFGELKFTHKPFYVGITTGAYVKIENERCLEYLNKLADINEQPLMFKQYYHVDEHVALQLKQKLVNRIGTIEQGSILVNNPVQVNDNYVNKEDKFIAITNIEELEEREDVYCLTVEGLGNFAIQTNKGNVIVENCADYYWTFAWSNAENNVHKGKKPPLYLNTEIRGRAIRNPRNTPGCCKHLVALLAILMEEGILRDRESLVKQYKSKNNVKAIKSGEFKLSRFKEDIEKSVRELDNYLEQFIAKAKQAEVKALENNYVQQRQEARKYDDESQLVYGHNKEEEKTTHRNKYGLNMLNYGKSSGKVNKKQINQINSFRNSAKNDIKKGLRDFKKW